MWKRLSALLLALLLCSSLAFSEELEKVYYLTETELLQLDAIFGMLKTQNAELRSLLSESIEEVNGLKENSKKLDAELMEVRDSLARASASLNTYARDMSQALSTARTKTVLFTILGVAAGGLVGYIIGAF